MEKKYKIIILQASQFTYENAKHLARELEETTGDVFFPITAMMEDIIKIVDIK